MSLRILLHACALSLLAHHALAVGASREDLALARRPICYCDYAGDRTCIAVGFATADGRSGLNAVDIDLVDAGAQADWRRRNVVARVRTEADGSYVREGMALPDPYSSQRLWRLRERPLQHGLEGFVATCLPSSIRVSPVTPN